MGNTTAVQGGAQQLVRVFDGVIGGMTMHAVDGRELHAFLKNGDRFAGWIKARVEKYGFEENRDFAIASGFSEAKRGGHNRVDYHLTLDMAKELSMVENNDQGRAARRYFIDMERKARNQPVLPVPDRFERLAQAHRGFRIEFLRNASVLWVKASCVCRALGFESSDRITRGLPAERKLVQMRGLQRHVFIDPEAAMRASGYCRDVQRGQNWEAWLAQTLPGLQGQAAPALAGPVEGAPGVALNGQLLEPEWSATAAERVAWRDLQEVRLLSSYDVHGKMRSKSIDPEAVICRPDQFPELVRDTLAYPVELLWPLLDAVTERLKRGAPQQALASSSAGS